MLCRFFLGNGRRSGPRFAASIPSRDHLEGKTMSTGGIDTLTGGPQKLDC